MGAGEKSDARRRILAAAAGVFSRRGYAAASVQAVLAGTGYSKPTLYYHFGSKAGLFKAILDFAYDESFRMMSDAVARHEGSGTALVEVTLALFRFTRANADLTRLVFASMFAAAGEQPAGSLDAARRRRNADLILRIVLRGQERGELDPAHRPADLVQAVLGAISHRVRSHLLDPGVPLDAASARRLVALFLSGAKTNP
jgi:AcrR family transcriptional regulator